MDARGIRCLACHIQKFEQVGERYKMKTADEITEMMTVAIIEDGPYTRTVREWDGEKGEWYDLELTDDPFQSGDQVIAFVNSMGGTPVSELYAVYRKLAQDVGGFRNSDRDCRPHPELVWRAVLDTLRKH